MKTLKDYVKEWIENHARVTSTDATAQESTLDNLPEVEKFEKFPEVKGSKVNATSENFAPEVVTEDLPIYETTAKEMNFLHAFGNLCELQTLLQKYDLGFGSRDHAYDKFKVGYNQEEHYASFAIDDTHYYKIQFTEYDGEPIDRQAAKKVLEKINAMRGEK